MKWQHTIPVGLKGKIPKRLADFYFYRYFFGLFGIGMAIFGLAYGNILQHNGFRYLLVPIIIPWLAAILILIFPQNPYREKGLIYPANLNGLDTTDGDAKQLVEIYRSPEARKIIIKCTAGVCIVLFAIMAIVTVVQWSTLNWTLSFNAPGIGPAIVLGFFGSLSTINAYYIKWGLETWITTCQRKMQSTSKSMDGHHLDL